MKLNWLDPRRTPHFVEKGRDREGDCQGRGGSKPAAGHLYAEGKRALLIVLQGTDTAGKDGTIRDIFQRDRASRWTCHAFRRPSEEELSHDHLWRVHRALPAPGTIGTSALPYEDVLVAKVRKLPSAPEIERRYDQLNALKSTSARTAGGF